MGYDVPLKTFEGGYSFDYKAMRAKFPYEEKLSDIMKTVDGRAWWKTNGTGFEMDFDLSEGSRSRKILEAYNEEVKADKAAGRRVADQIEARAYHADRDEGDEAPYIDDEIMDRVWDRIANEK